MHVRPTASLCFLNLQRAAEKNKIDFSPSCLDVRLNYNKEDSPKYRTKDLFQTSQLKITLCLIFSWITIILCYYGLTVSADKMKLTENIYLSFILVTLVEVPALIACPVLVDYLGRRPVFVLSQLIPGLFCMVAAFIQPGTVLYSFLTLFSKSLSSLAFGMAFLYTAELYPTTVRNTAVGLCASLGRIGGMLAPWIGKFLPNEGYFPQYVPLCLFGGFNIISGLCAIQLPETLGHTLPRTFEDVEETKKNGKPFWHLGRLSRDGQELQTLLHESNSDMDIYTKSLLNSTSFPK